MDAGRRGFWLLEALLRSAAVTPALLYFKYSYLRAEGWDLVAAFLPGEKLGPLGIGALFGRDLLEGLLVLPIVLAIVGWLAPRRARGRVVLVGILLVFGWLLVSWVVRGEVGQLPTGALVSDWLAAVQREPWAVMPERMPPLHALLPLFLLLALVVGISRIAPWIAGSVTRLRLAVGGWTAAVAVAAVLVVTGPSVGPFGRGYAGQVFSLLVTRHAAVAPVATRGDVQKLYEDAGLKPPAPTRQLQAEPAVVHAPLRLPVIWFVLETAGLPDYDFEAFPQDFPYLHALASRSLLATRHFASSDYSAKADMAIQASLLDGPSRSMLLDDLPEHVHTSTDSLAGILDAAGYRTIYLIAGHFMFDSERRMIDFLGFQEVHEIGVQSSYVVSMDRHRRVANERMLFARAAREVGEACRAGQPFFLTVRSMIGHGPFPDVEHPGRRNTPRAERMAMIRRFLDRHIARVMKAARGCAAGDPMVLVVGDHGYRVREEDAQVDLRWPDHLRFRVPLLIYSPTLPGPVRIRAITSHLDIVPTFLDLLGRPQRGDLHAGLSMFDPAIRSRWVPMLSRFSGDTVLTDGSRFYVQDLRRDLTLASPELKFEARDLLPPGSPERADVRRRVAELTRARLSLPAILAGGSQPAEGAGR